MNDDHDDFDEDFLDEEEEEYDPGEECGRWRNGELAPYYECLQAGTEFCDWECPYSRPSK